PEFAREYIENLDRKYTYNDVEAIAQKQIEFDKTYTTKNDFIFYDTWLIISKVWFDFVFKKHPEWLHQAILKSQIDLFLVCDTDMPWVFDPVRENGGENRNKLQKMYINELEKYNFKYRIIDGSGEQRLKKAIKIVSQLSTQ
ncbi:MAG: ATP-binding protein, partial [Prolixibacteraceae bacterium]|nr:ATP-binding protein [Prolixibacteraceae bacterium]